MESCLHVQNRSLQKSNNLNSRVANRLLGSLVSAVDLPRPSIEAGFQKAHFQVEGIRNEASQLHNDFNTRLQNLSTGVSAILEDKFSAFASMILRGQSEAEAINHTTPNVLATANTFDAVSDGLRWLPMRMSELVKDTFRQVLREFYVDVQDVPQAQPLPLNCNANTSSAIPNSDRRVFRQSISTQNYLRAIGIITVQAIATTFIETRNPSLLESSTPSLSTVTQTHVELNPHPDLVRFGVYLSFVQQGFASFPCHPQPNLRIFNVVGLDAPIVHACCTGDLPAVRMLFATRQASPFDRVFGDRSLLNLVLNKFLASVRARTVSHNTVSKSTIS